MQALSSPHSLVKVVRICANCVLDEKKKVLRFFGFVNECG